MSTIGGAMGKILKKEAKKEEEQRLGLSTPGANYYKPKDSLTKQRVRSTIVFKGDRIDFSKTITGSIGPGQYELRKNLHLGELGKINNGRKRDLYATDRNVMMSLSSLGWETTIFQIQ
jgi:hypothetical protein